MKTSGSFPMFENCAVRWLRRVKVKIVEGCSPAPTLTSDSTKSWQRTIGMSPPPAKHPKRLSFEHVEDDSYAGIMDYKSPIELDTGREKNPKFHA